MWCILKSEMYHSKSVAVPPAKVGTFRNESILIQSKVVSPKVKLKYSTFFTTPQNQMTYPQGVPVHRVYFPLTLCRNDRKWWCASLFQSAKPTESFQNLPFPDDRKEGQSCYDVQYLYYSVLYKHHHGTYSSTKETFGCMKFPHGLTGHFHFVLG